MAVYVQTADFDTAAEINALRLRHPAAGAVVSFVGQVRDVNDGDAIATLSLEHYPGMTEKALQKIADEAAQRWLVLESTIIHRVGTLKPQDQIVLVAVASAHREAAFNACAFIMDFLKTQAPFWKKENTSNGERWVEAKRSDDAAKARWENPE